MPRVSLFHSFVVLLTVTAASTLGERPAPNQRKGRKCKARIAVMALEWLNPVFSGNGVYGRSLVHNLVGRGACVAVVSARPHTAPALADQVRSDVDVGALGGKIGCGRGSTARSVCRSRDGNLIAEVVVNASRWRRLGLDGEWASLADGLAAASDAFRAVAAFRPHVIMAVDWHGALAAEAYQQSWSSLCSALASGDSSGLHPSWAEDSNADAFRAFKSFATKRCGSGVRRTPVTYMNFRLFAGSAALARSDADLLAYAAAEAAAVRGSARTVALSRRDVDKLRSLPRFFDERAPWAGSGSDGVRERASDSPSWWTNLQAWAKQASQQAWGRSLAAELRSALQTAPGAAPVLAATEDGNEGNDGAGASDDRRFSVLLPPLRRSIRDRALLDPDGFRVRAASAAADAAGVEESAVSPGQLEQQRELMDAQGLYTGKTAQHDQLPWLELFDRWLMDGSKRARQDDTDAWLASHTAAFMHQHQTQQNLPEEVSLVTIDATLGGDAGSDSPLLNQLPMETLHNDSLVVATPAVRRRPHRFKRPALLRFDSELHPTHPAFSDLAVAARNARKEEEAEQHGEKEPSQEEEEEEGRPSAEERRQMANASWSEVVEKVYDFVKGERAQLLPPRWIAEAGHHMDEGRPDKLLLTARTIRSGFDRLQAQDEREHARAQEGGDTTARNVRKTKSHRRRLDGSIILDQDDDDEDDDDDDSPVELAEHVQREVDEEKNPARRARLLAAAKAAAKLQRPRESVLLPSRRFLLWCSRVSPEKRPMLFPLAVRIMANLVESTGLIPAICVDGPDEALNRKVERAMLQAHPEALVLSGFLPPERLADVFARTVLFVHTAEYEAYGMTPVEAAAFGTPTLAHDPGCVGPPGTVCSGALPGTNAPQLAPEEASETLKACGERLAPYRRGETGVLYRLFKREREAAKIAADTEAVSKVTVERLQARADRLASAHDELFEAKRTYKPPRVNGSFTVSSEATTNTAAASSSSLPSSDPPPAVGSLELLSPRLGRAYSTDMTTDEPWRLALAMARIVCRRTLRTAFQDAGLGAFNMHDAHVAALEIPFRPATAVPGMAAWLNTEVMSKSVSARLSDARTGEHSGDTQRMLRCREDLLHGFDGPLSLQQHLDDCACLGFAAEHHAHALPLHRGERVAAGVRNRDFSSRVEAQDKKAEADDSPMHKPHPALPHPGCVGLAARQAALAWTEEDCGAALLRTLVRTVKDDKASG